MATIDLLWALDFFVISILAFVTHEMTKASNYTGAKYCVWLSALSLLGMDLMWTVFTNHSPPARVIVSGLVGAIAFIGLSETLRYIAKSEARAATPGEPTGKNHHKSAPNSASSTGQTGGVTGTQNVGRDSYNFTGPATVILPGKTAAPPHPQEQHRPAPPHPNGQNPSPPVGMLLDATNGQIKNVTITGSHIGGMSARGNIDGLHVSDSDITAPGERSNERLSVILGEFSKSSDAELRDNALSTAKELIELDHYYVIKVQEIGFRRPPLEDKDKMIEFFQQRNAETMALSEDMRNQFVLKYRQRSLSIIGEIYHRLGREMPYVNDPRTAGLSARPGSMAGQPIRFVASALEEAGHALENRQK
ncbi:MAG TPA: hypothetical protein VKQ54_12680 [Caulobacteraceae bacterium]|nr:hypothetical protein [Caulobacteraceae bacterium]